MWCNECNSYVSMPHPHAVHNTAPAVQGFTYTFPDTGSLNRVEIALERIIGQLERIADALEAMEDDHKPPLRSILD